ncbi:ninjurin-B-like [Mytilus edulis]|uniref:ninjurin-B-like n=1 Tax=Mytilus edulis TaxID=6550 RepID=UPI0039F0D6E0
MEAEIQEQEAVEPAFEYKVKSESTMSQGDEAKEKTKRSERKVYPENQTIPEDMTNARNESNSNPVENNKNDLPSSNRFTESKNFIQSIADVSLMMANISQLRAILGCGDSNSFYIHLMTLVILSLVSHIIFVFFTVIRSHFKYKHRIAVKRAKEGVLKDGSVRYCCCLTEKYIRNEYNDSDLCQCPHCYADLYLNYICNILVFITICANIGITGIGITGEC